MYPCPKCEKGMMKLRHHICPCDQDKIGAAGVVRVTYTGTARRRPAAPAAAAPGTDKSSS
jgi:hypothetical protein